MSNDEKLKLNIWENSKPLFTIYSNGKLEFGNRVKELSTEEQAKKFIECVELQTLPFKQQARAEVIEECISKLKLKITEPNLQAGLQSAISTLTKLSEETK